MTMNEQEKLWMACLDGEMTVSEASAFDEQLSPAERDRLAAEARIEAGISQVLRQEVSCPDALWKQLQLRMENDTPKAPATRTPWARMALVAASMLIVGMAAMWYLDHAAVAPPQVALHGNTPQDPDVFALRSVTESSPEAVESYLHKHGIELTLAKSLHETPGGAGSHAVTLLGSCQGNCPFGSIVEVMFLCEGKPARVLVTKVDSPGAHMILDALDSGEIKSTKRIGGYIAGVICDGGSDGLLDLLQEAPQHIT